MVDGSVRMDLRMIVATWPDEAPRGAVTRFCGEQGLSRSAFYAIRARARAEGAAAAAVPRSRRPRVPAGQTAAAVEEMAVAVRKQLVEQGWDAGPLSVQARMRADGFVSPSRSTLARIFTRRGLVVPEPAKRPRASWRRFVYAAPNECWQLDATEWVLSGGTKVVALQVIDDHSRRLLASLAAPAETAAAAVTVVRTAIERVGVPQRLLTDNGTAFNMSRRGMTGPLQTHLLALGVHPIASSPYHPQTCGKNERVHSTLKRWLRARPHPHDLPAFQALLDTFDAHYNTARVHQALPGLTPQAAWDATPAAAQPSPPDPTTSRQSTRPAPRPRRNKVSHNGNVGAGGVIIQVGTSHAGTHVHVLVEGTTITVLDDHGVLLRRVDRVPDRHYYGNGLPRGRRPPKPSTL